jgi:hypothetical protein
MEQITPWRPEATSSEIRECFHQFSARAIERLDKQLDGTQLTPAQQIATLLMKSTVLINSGNPSKAYAVLEQVRALAETDESLSERSLYGVIYLQGVATLRRGETENCIMCRGESSCILPIAPAAVHLHPEGSRLEIQHFLEYLTEFPDDLEVRWLLNVAQMTLGEYPDQVDSRYLVSLDHYLKNEFDIGKFRDIGHKLGVDSLNQAGGAIMDDFDNDGWLDLFFCCERQPSRLYRNRRDGTFEDVTERAGVRNYFEQCKGAAWLDFDNDGFQDLFLTYLTDQPNSQLFQNNRDGTFTAVAEPNGIRGPSNGFSCWAWDYDNDGWMDLFTTSYRRPLGDVVKGLLGEPPTYPISCLYRN